MSIKITMPALSPTMEEGTLSKWLVKEGDIVGSGDVIAEIETDKATMEVEAADSGIVAKIVVPSGTTGVKVNSLIAILMEEDEDKTEAVKSAMAGATSAVSGATPQTTETQALPAEQVSSTVMSTERNKLPEKAESERIFASPLARRQAVQEGIDIAQVKGTGPYGRVVARDIAAAKAAGVVSQIGGGSILPPASMQEAAVLGLYKPDEYEVVPHASMRKVIARRLVESKQYVPHFYTTVDCELDSLLKLRSELNAAAPIIKNEEMALPAYKLSVNDMVIKAVALALKQIPDANVSWLEDGMVRHKHSDVGVAVSIPNGLITPIVRHAEEKSLSVISNEMKELIKRAKQMKLKPDEYQGGTVSVSNMGMFGVKSFSAIVNPPQAVIFAIGAGEKRAVVKDDILATANVMSVTLSVDHRAVDGALSAELAQCFKGIIESPLSMLI